MSHEAAPDATLLTSHSLEEYFRGSVLAALRHQEVRAAQDTTCYLVNLLTAFTRTERLYARSAEGPLPTPLALLWGEALEAGTAEERRRALKHLGDVALFIAGLFSDSLSRRLVDVDYYVAMGGNAYASLADLLGQSWQGRAQAPTFGELATKFQDFVDVLAEVGEATGAARDRDVLRSYELWLRTGSERARRQLRALGIEPLARPARLVHH